MDIFERDRREELDEERRAFLERHSVDAYAAALLEGMGLQ
jgi:hypothetical protein